MKIYRIETVNPVVDEDGAQTYAIEHVGPYVLSVYDYEYEDNSDEIYDAVVSLLDDHNDDAHPSAYEDFWEFSPKHVCGAGNAETLRDWFGVHYDRLLNTGFFDVAIYDVPDDLVVLSRSGWQVAFRPEHADRLTS